MKKVYIIKIESQVTGFFALFRKVLVLISFAEHNNMTPYVEYSKDILYAEQGVFKGTENPFEYYFCQVSDRVNDIRNCKNTLFSRPKDFDMEEQRLAGREFSYFTSPEYIYELSKIYKKYIKLKEDIRTYIDDKIKSIIDKKTLGIHIRGTDFQKNFNNHPIPITVNQILEKIKEAIMAGGYEQIFIATDDTNILAEITSRIELPVRYHNVKRADGHMSVAFSKDDREHHNYSLGLEVLLDAYTLASCEGFIGCLSQVDIAVQVIKKSLDSEFEYLCILDNGIVKNDKNCWEPNRNAEPGKRQAKLYDAWMYLLERDVHLSEYFIKRNLHRIAIYGYGHIGHHVFDQLKKEGITISYIIEQRMMEMEAARYTVEDELPDVDIVVVTALNDYDEIKVKLEKKKIERVASIEDIIYELL